VVIENFSPRVMANWGLDYETLSRVKPEIIMAGMAAMGHTGPWKDYTAFAPTIQSLTGHSLLNSYAAKDPGGLEFSLSDIVAGLYCAMAVLAALEHRSRTGRGRFIDLSQYEAACTLLGPALIKAATRGKGAVPESGRYDDIAAAPYGCYPCSGNDRWCAIAVYNDDQWQQLCHAMGDPQWTRQSRFATLAGRKQNRSELDKHIAVWTSGRPAREIFNCLQQVRVPAAMVADAQDLASDHHLASRNFFIDMTHPLLGKVTADRCPIRFMGEVEDPHRSAPLLGEHNTYVYKEVIGLSDKDYAGYRSEGVIT
jgi:crotonobetainyl-CoA:carnitine CoA-transferase CaiB-like acyl-CoA transferase